MTGASATTWVDASHNRAIGPRVLLDEVPGTCKDMDEVTEYAEDLTDVNYALTQIVTVEGD